MPLIDSPRLRPGDIEHWKRLEAYDRRAATAALARKEARALDEMRSFFDAGPGYVGTSWGKDSVIVAHLLVRLGLDVPLVWVRVDRLHNPDCVLVRDAFLARFPCRYDEIVTRCTWDGSR